MLDPQGIGTSRRIGPGILYVEDFDLPSADAADAEDRPEIIEPVFSAAELAAARAAGYEAGCLAAVTDARLVEAQLQRAALQSLADAVAASRAEVAAMAEQAAEATARAVFATLAAALPVLMERHGAGELAGLVSALLPGLRQEPVLRIRAHPAYADGIRALLDGELDAETQWNVEPDARLAPPDIAIHWRDGGTRRDSRAICDAVRGLLDGFGLAGVGAEPAA
jgi:hypothetical protein